MSTKQERIEIFEGTHKLYIENEFLKNAVNNSIRNQKIYWEGEEISFQSPCYSKPFNILVSTEKTVEASRKYAEEGKKVCILNFASSVAPGGGVLTGEQAQEESICRVSTLYFSLSHKESAGRFYDHHWELIRAGKMNRRNTDDIIYTPGVVVVRNDADNEKFLDEKDWYQVDVITCAAPDIRKIGDQTEYSPKIEELYNEFVKRWKLILSAGAKHNAEVLILGAFGCGVFANPPEMVAEAFLEAAKGFETCFKTIEFAIYGSKENNINYQEFEKILDNGK